MKDIMGKQSSITNQGVPSFEYDQKPQQLSLFDSKETSLEEILMHDFSGQRITVKQIYENHHVGTRYIKKNYKEALLKLESLNRIIANPSKRRKNTFGDKVQVTFPPKQ